MADNLKDYYIAFALIMVFIVAIINFNIGFHEENETNVSLMDSEAMIGVYGNVTDDLDNQGNLGDTQFNATMEGKISETTTETSYDSSFGVGKGTINSIKGTAKTLFNTLDKIIPPFVLTVLLGLLATMLTFWIWKWIKQGEQDEKEKIK